MTRLRWLTAGESHGPALTVILGLLLLAVMSAVMLPIYDIVSRMKL